MLLRRPLESALAASVAVMHQPTAMQRPPVMQSLVQRVEHEARVRCCDARQPTMRRAYASMTKAT
jgi:hypothetical protein